jgi:hypothetical protein
MKPCIPTLDSVGRIITEPKQIAAYLLRQIFAQPADGTDMYRDHIVSFRLLHAQYGNHPDTFAEIFQDKLSVVFSRYLPNADVQVQADVPSDPSKAYTLNISILAQDSSGTNDLVLTNGLIEIGQDGQTFTINFTGTQI